MSDSAIELVVFDFGNVLALVDEGPPIKRLAGMSGRSEAEVFDVVFAPERKALFEAGKQSWAEHARFVTTALDMEIDEIELGRLIGAALTPYEPMYEVAQRIASACPIGLASNTSEPHWQWAEANLPFVDQLDPIILSYRVGAMKPDAAFYEALIGQADTSPEHIFFTDDVAENITGARALGINAVQFTGVEALLRDLRSLGLQIEAPGS